MAFITYKGVGVRAIAACVPAHKIYNKDLDYIIQKEEIDKLINNIGIKERRIADKDVCSSDLCYKAATKLIEDNNIDVSTIDMLIFVSTTPDYKSPSTAILLQKRLGLPTTVACFDITLGCSGYIYGLSTSFAYASLPGINRVLLLVGETPSKFMSRYDKVNWPLCGDAGTATLTEKGNFKDACFELMSDGSGAQSLIIPAGGYRNPVTVENLQETEREDGNKRSDNQVYMDGMDVFNFTLRVVPKSIKNVLSFLNKQPMDIDYLVLHQANKFLTDFLAKRMKFDMLQVPYSIDRFGNTGPTSIPLTIVTELENKLETEKQMLLCGFGIGLSWGTAFIIFNNCNISSLIEY